MTADSLPDLRAPKVKREPPRVVETVPPWTISEHPSARLPFRFQAVRPFDRAMRGFPLVVSGPTLEFVRAFIRPEAPKPVSPGATALLVAAAGLAGA
jgi:hypothetical protein